VELEKVGHYRLGAGQTLPEARDVARGLHLVYGAALLAAGLLAGIRLTLCWLFFWPLAF
jgi:adenosylcobinamide-phosphate synthase